MDSWKLRYEDAARRDIRITVVIMCVLLVMTIGALWAGWFLLAALCGLGMLAGFIAIMIFMIMGFGDA